MQHRKLKRYKEGEVQVIAQAISTYPANLSMAFEQAAKQLPGRDAAGVSNYYYRKMKNDSNLPMLAIASNMGAMVNTKQIRRPKEKGVSLALQVAFMAVQELDPGEIMQLIRSMLSKK